MVHYDVAWSWVRTWSFAIEGTPRHSWPLCFTIAAAVNSNRYSIPVVIHAPARHRRRLHEHGHVAET